MLQVELILEHLVTTYICFRAAVHGKVMDQIKDIDSLRPKEISVYWVGMAEVNILYPLLYIGMEVIA
jgi:hypothetical protein